MAAGEGGLRAGRAADADCTAGRGAGRTCAHRPFRHDPSATAAFKALSGARPAVAPGEHVRAVVIGGGTGAPMSIRALLSLGMETSAVVAMADDGGSTGILRQEADVTPPGDVRKCIAAFARDPNDPLTRAFKYRFEFARDHTLGNLMLSALEDASGSFPEAIRICERLLDAQGHVYPSTLDRVSLVARTCTGEVLEGQAHCCAAPAALERVRLASEHAPVAFGPALDAIRAADLIVLGPGSLFTSIIPNLLVPGVEDAIRSSAGAVVFVCSLADMQGETRGLDVRGHVGALASHGMRGLVDYVLVHVPGPLRPGQTPAPDPREAAGVRPVPLAYEDAAAIQQEGITVIARNLADRERPTWHDPCALRNALLEVLERCRSQRR